MAGANEQEEREWYTMWPDAEVPPEGPRNHVRSFIFAQLEAMGLLRGLTQNVLCAQKGPSGCVKNRLREAGGEVYTARLAGGSWGGITR